MLPECRSAIRRRGVRPEPADKMRTSASADQGASGFSWSKPGGGRAAGFGVRPQRPGNNQDGRGRRRRWLSHPGGGLGRGCHGRWRSCLSPSGRLGHLGRELARGGQVVEGAGSSRSGRSDDRACGPRTWLPGCRQPRRSQARRQPAARLAGAASSPASWLIWITPSWRHPARAEPPLSATSTCAVRPTSRVGFSPRSTTSPWAMSHRDSRPAGGKCACP